MPNNYRLSSLRLLLRGMFFIRIHKKTMYGIKCNACHTGCQTNMPSAKLWKQKASKLHWLKQLVIRHHNSLLCLHYWPMEQSISLQNPSQHWSPAGSTSCLLWRFDCLNSRRKIYYFCFVSDKKKRQKECPKRNSQKINWRFKNVYLACLPYSLPAIFNPNVILF